MLKSLKNVAIFNNLSQEIAKPSHAYLFYGEDKMLNVELAKLFVASIFCGKPACLQCEVCKRTDINKNPDLLIIDKPSLQVADISGLIENVQLKPMIYDYKIIFITNAEGINETAQNKLLKTLEEPNPQVIFVLTCTNVEKLLPTIRSRLNKYYIPNINLSYVAEDLKQQGINVDKFLHCDITLTDAVKYSHETENEVLLQVEQSICQLKSSSDIPQVVSKLKIKTEQRREYLQLLLTAVDCALTDRPGIFSEAFIRYMQTTFNQKVLIKMLKLTDVALKMLDANTNFNYVLDQLFFNILKEKYLCK